MLQVACKKFEDGFLLPNRFPATSDDDKLTDEGAKLIESSFKCGILSKNLHKYKDEIEDQDHDDDYQVQYDDEC